MQGIWALNVFPRQCEACSSRRFAIALDGLKHDLRRLKAREKDNSDVLAKFRGG